MLSKSTPVSAPILPQLAPLPAPAEKVAVPLDAFDHGDSAAPRLLPCVWGAATAMGFVGMVVGGIVANPHGVCMVDCSLGAVPECPPYAYRCHGIGIGIAGTLLTPLVLGALTAAACAATPRGRRWLRGH